MNNKFDASNKRIEDLEKKVDELNKNKTAFSDEEKINFVTEITEKVIERLKADPSLKGPKGDDGKDGISPSIYDILKPVRETLDRLKSNNYITKEDLDRSNKELEHHINQLIAEIREHPDKVRADIEGLYREITLLRQDIDYIDGDHSEIKDNIKRLEDLFNELRDKKGVPDNNKLLELEEKVKALEDRPELSDELQDIRNKIKLISIPNTVPLSDVKPSIPQIPTPIQTQNVIPVSDDKGRAKQLLQRITEETQYNIKYQLFVSLLPLLGYRKLANGWMKYSTGVLHLDEVTIHQLFRYFGHVYVGGYWIVGRM